MRLKSEGWTLNFISGSCKSNLPPIKLSPSPPLSVVSPAPSAPPSVSSSLSPLAPFALFLIHVHAAKTSPKTHTHTNRSQTVFGRHLVALSVSHLTCMILSISTSCLSFPFSSFSVSWTLESSDWLLRLLQVLRLRSRWLCSRWSRRFSLSSW